MANYSPNIRKRRAGAPCSLDSTLQIKHKHKYRRARVCTVLASLNLTQQLGKSSTSKIKHKHKYKPARVWRAVHLLKRLKISCCRKNARKQKRGQAQLSCDGISNVQVNAVTRRPLRTHRGKILLIFTVALMIMIGTRC